VNATLCRRLRNKFLETRANPTNSAGAWGVVSVHPPLAGVLPVETNG
jgi:hypothetical protein